MLESVRGERGPQRLPQLTRRRGHEGLILEPFGGRAKAAGIEQHQPQQRGLRGLDGPLDGPWIQRARLCHHRLEVDARASPGAIARVPRRGP